MKKENKCEACKFNEFSKQRFGEKAEPIGKCTCEATTSLNIQLLASK
jgi:hypothetical protein